MPQFDVYRNANPETRSVYPLLLDVQNDLVSVIATRVVVPLCTAAALRDKSVHTLMPVLEVGGKNYVMLTPQLAGIAANSLGARVTSLAAERQKVIAALDLLFTGF